MIVSLRSRRWRLALLLVLIGVLAVAFLAVRSAGSDQNQAIAGGTNEERLAYINSFGWTVETQPLEEAQVVIPEQFNEVYSAYNELQLAEGFDLRTYAGKTCTHYRYAVTNYPGEENVSVSLLVYEDKIIGADVAFAELGGFMHRIDERPETGRASGEETASQTESTVSQAQESAESEP